MTQEEIPPPYEKVGPIARYLKAWVQMAIGLVAVVSILTRLGLELCRRIDVHTVSHNLFSSIGLALGAAAVVELAYTLYTHGPDEALDPVMLGIAATLLVQLGQVETFRPEDGLAAALYAAALAGLFATRKWLAKSPEPTPLPLKAAWKRLWSNRSQDEKPPVPNHPRQRRERGKQARESAADKPSDA